LKRRKFNSFPSSLTAQGRGAGFATGGISNQQLQLK